MCNLLVSCTLEIFFMCLCSAIYMSCIHELYTCDCSPLCFIYLCSCNLLVCCILVLMLVLCNLHELVVYMWLFTSVFHLLVQLQFTCVLHTCVNACALQHSGNTIYVFSIMIAPWKGRSPNSWRSWASDTADFTAWHKTAEKKCCLVLVGDVGTYLRLTWDLLETCLRLTCDCYLWHSSTAWVLFSILLETYLWLVHCLWI